MCQVADQCNVQPRTSEGQEEGRSETTHPGATNRQLPVEPHLEYLGDRRWPLVSPVDIRGADTQQRDGRESQGVLGQHTHACARSLIRPCEESFDSREELCRRGLAGL